MTKHRRSNCFFYALTKWRKFGGYLVIRRSHHGWWPHFIWCKDLKDAQIEHYAPKREGRENPYIKKFFFDGEIRTKDKLRRPVHEIDANAK